MKKIILQLQNEVLMSDHKLHYELFKIKTNLEFKVFLAILANATMICKANKEFEKSQTFNLKGFLSNDSYIPRNNLNKGKLENIINSFDANSFFDELSCADGVVNFTLSKEYRETFKSKGFQKIDLLKIKSYKDVNTTKIAVLTQIKPKGFYYLNHLTKLLNLPSELQRASKIRAVKRAFSKVDGITFSYVYPKNGETKTKNHYRFNYEPIEIEEVEELEAVEEVKIEEIEEFIEEEYTADYFDEELEKVEEIEKEEPFIDFDFLNMSDNPLEMKY